MSIELAATLMFVIAFAAMFAGVPVAFGFGGTAILMALLFSPNTLMAAPMIFFRSPWLDVIMTVPMFLFMGNLIRHSGIADVAYDMAYKLVGAVPGGLAIGTVVVCTLFAAITGIAAPATVTMGLIAIPSMLNHKYHKTIAIGSVGAGGALGILIPPSCPFILYGVIAKESVGALFMGGVIPGIMLSTMYMVYIYIRCKLDPKMGPPVPLEERVPWSERIKSVIAIWPFIGLIFLVLGTIWFGVATPKEASCFGAGGALFLNALYRRLSWSVVRESLNSTVRLTVMGLFIFIGVNIWVGIFSALGCQDLITSVVLAMPGGKWGIMAMIMVSILVLGCVMDDWAIIILTTPLYVPIIMALGFSKLWFGILLVININIALLTPPFGFVLFWLKGIVPKGVTIADIYRSIFPFVCIQIVGLILVMIFPQIGLWLPGTMVK